MTHSPEAVPNNNEKYIHHIIELAKTKVRDTSEYQRLRAEGTPHPDAFRRVAEHVARDEKNDVSEPDRALLMVTANLGVFAEAQHELNSIHKETEHRRPDDDEYHVMRHLKDEYIIPFNHHLKDFINTHPNDELRAVSSAFANAEAMIFGRYTSLSSRETIYGDKPQSAEVLKGLYDSLDGMRHEVAAESLLEAADYSFDYKVSTQEDATGADLFVYLESGWEGVDIKASPIAVEKARASHRFSRAVWTGLNWEDFTGQRGTGHGTLSIPFSTATEKCDAFVNGIYEMTQRNRLQRSVASQHAGKRGLSRV